VQQLQISAPAPASPRTPAIAPAQQPNITQRLKQRQEQLKQIGKGFESLDQAESALPSDSRATFTPGIGKSYRLPKKMPLSPYA
jgi:hypothetical protein